MQGQITDEPPCFEESSYYDLMRNEEEQKENTKIEQKQKYRSTKQPQNRTLARPQQQNLPQTSLPHVQQLKQQQHNAKQQQQQHVTQPYKLTQLNQQNQFQEPQQTGIQSQTPYRQNRHVIRRNKIFAITIVIVAILIIVVPVIVAFSPEKKNVVQLSIHQGDAKKYQAIVKTSQKYDLSTVQKTSVYQLLFICVKKESRKAQMVVFVTAITDVQNQNNITSRFGALQIGEGSLVNQSKLDQLNSFSFDYYIDTGVKENIKYPKKMKNYFIGIIPSLINSYYPQIKKAFMGKLNQDQKAGIGKVMQNINYSALDDVTIVTKTFNFENDSSKVAYGYNQSAVFFNNGTLCNNSHLMTIRSILKPDKGIKTNQLHLQESLLIKYSGYSTLSIRQLQFLVSIYNMSDKSEFQGQYNLTQSLLNSYTTNQLSQIKKDRSHGYSPNDYQTVIFQVQNSVESNANFQGNSFSNKHSIHLLVALKNVSHNYSVSGYVAQSSFFKLNQFQQQVSSTQANFLSKTVSNMLVYQYLVKIYQDNMTKYLKCLQQVKMHVFLFKQFQSDSESRLALHSNEINNGVIFLQKLLNKYEAAFVSNKLTENAQSIASSINIKIKQLANNLKIQFDFKLIQTNNALNFVIRQAVQLRFFQKQQQLVFLTKTINFGSLGILNMYLNLITLSLDNLQSIRDQQRQQSQLLQSVKKNMSIKKQSLSKTKQTVVTQSSQFDTAAQNTVFQFGKLVGQHYRNDIRRVLDLKSSRLNSFDQMILQLQIVSKQKTQLLINRITQLSKIHQDFVQYYYSTLPEIVKTKLAIQQYIKAASDQMVNAQQQNILNEGPFYTAFKANSFFREWIDFFLSLFSNLKQKTDGLNFDVRVAQDHFTVLSSMEQTIATILEKTHQGKQFFTAKLTQMTSIYSQYPINYPVPYQQCCQSFFGCIRYCTRYNYIVKNSRSKFSTAVDQMTKFETMFSEFHSKCTELGNRFVKELNDNKLKFFTQKGFYDLMHKWKYLHLDLQYFVSASKQQYDQFQTHLLKHSQVLSTNLMARADHQNLASDAELLLGQLQRLRERQRALSVVKYGYTYTRNSFSYNEWVLLLSSTLQQQILKVEKFIENIGKFPIDSAAPNLHQTIKYLAITYRNVYTYLEHHRGIMERIRQFLDQLDQVVLSITQAVTALYAAKTKQDLLTTVQRVTNYGVYSKKAYDLLADLGQPRHLMAAVVAPCLDEQQIGRLKAYYYSQISYSDKFSQLRLSFQTSYQQSAPLNQLLDSINYRSREFYFLTQRVLSIRTQLSSYLTRLNGLFASSRQALAQLGQMKPVNAPRLVQLFDKVTGLSRSVNDTVSRMLAELNIKQVYEEVQRNNYQAEVALQINFILSLLDRELGQLLPKVRQVAYSLSEQAFQVRQAIFLSNVSAFNDYKKKLQNFVSEYQQYATNLLDERLSSHIDDLQKLRMVPMMQFSQQARQLTKDLVQHYHSGIQKLTNDFASALSTIRSDNTVKQCNEALIQDLKQLKLITASRVFDHFTSIVQLFYQLDYLVSVQDVYLLGMLQEAIDSLISLRSSMAASVMAVGDSARFAQRQFLKLQALERQDIDVSLTWVQQNVLKIGQAARSAKLLFDQKKALLKTNFDRYRLLLQDLQPFLLLIQKSLLSFFDLQQASSKLIAQIGKLRKDEMYRKYRQLRIAKGQMQNNLIESEGTRQKGLMRKQKDYDFLSRNYTLGYGIPTMLGVLSLEFVFQINARQNSSASLVDFRNVEGRFQVGTKVRVWTIVRYGASLLRDSLLTYSYQLENTHVSAFLLQNVVPMPWVPPLQNDLDFQKNATVRINLNSDVAHQKEVLTLRSSAIVFQMYSSASPVAVYMDGKRFEVQLSGIDYVQKVQQGVPEIVHQRAASNSNYNIAKNSQVLW